jgi:NADH-quinone oxidoreductase subunit C
MTIVLSGNELADVIRGSFPEEVLFSDNGAVYVACDAIDRICKCLRDQPDQNFDLLNAITAVDWIDCFEMVYHITSTSRNVRGVIKSRVYGRDNPEVPSVISVWAGAGLQEREIYDLMGVSFVGHPDLRRIFLWEGFEGFPLRRDYLEPPLPYTWPHGG